MSTKEVTVKLSRKDERFLKLATSLAENSEMRMRHAAVIVKSGSVLSIGFNKFKNHPDIIETHKIKQHCSVHAEADAIKRLKGGNAKGATIYVARIGLSGAKRLSRPCNYCYEKIVEAGITKIVYTD